MDSITSYEYSCLAKLLSVAMGINRQNDFTHREVDVAYEAVKHLATQRIDWTRRHRGRQRDEEGLRGRRDHKAGDEAVERRDAALARGRVPTDGEERQQQLQGVEHPGN